LNVTDELLAVCPPFAVINATPAEPPLIFKTCFTLRSLLTPTPIFIPVYNVPSASPNIAVAFRIPFWGVARLKQANCVPF
jgi:hypothetical protein